MKLKSFLPLGAALALLAAGCGQKKVPVGFQARSVGRPDAGWKVDKAVKKSGQTDLDFQDASVDQVIGKMKAKFGCKVDLTRAALAHVRRKDPRITARVGRIPANLAFEVLRALLEAKGLTIQEAPGASALGRAHFLLDRSAVPEATVAAER